MQEDIVLVSVDSLRADHVGWHNYDRNTTPNLDDRASNGLCYSNAFAHACSTRPSFPSIFTSTYPLMYGGFERLSNSRVTFTEVLSENGYETGGFHSNLYLSADFGYNRGFDEFYDSKTDPSLMAKLRQYIKNNLKKNNFIYGLLQKAFNVFEKQVGIELGSAHINAEDITDLAINWASSIKDSPRFLWIHYMDVHHPYSPPKKYQKRFRKNPISDTDALKLRRKMLESPDKITEKELENIIDLYDAEIAYVDNEVERLLSELESIWGDINLFFVSDHGEEFLDHGGFSHSATFYDELLHIPLFMDINNDELSGTCDEVVGLLDLAPTILNKADTKIPKSYLGTPLQKAPTTNWDRDSIVAEWENTNTDDRRFAVRTNNWKYIKLEDSSEKLFNLDDNPKESKNIISEDINILNYLRKCIRNHKRLIETTDENLGDVKIDHETRERLRKLGYKE